MTIAAAMLARFGTQRLVELTNDSSLSGTAITVNTTTLNAAVDDAQGEFERLTGIALDDTNKSHVSIMIQGVIAFLEDYKGRDAGIVTGHLKRFYASCQAMREKVYLSASTNSTLTPSEETSGARPDMDRKKSVWNYGNARPTLPTDTAS